ncbi:MAG: sulfur carrier protein ThiS [Eubacteriales bacterium]
MLVVLNGRKTDLPAGTTVAGLIEKKNLNPDTVIVEYNGEVLKRESWPGTVLNENDSLELLRFVGGG